MSEFEEELSSLPVSKSTNDTEYWNKAQLLTVFKDWKPQQALPVVPEYVAEWYESHKDLDYAIYVFCGKFYRDTSRSNEELSDFEIWFDNSDNKAIETLILMKNGYQVEKPKLFYLKNKLTGLNLVLEKCFNPSGDHVGERFREYNMQYIATDEQEARLYKNTFTQEETDDLDTGGYERIEVEE